MNANLLKLIYGMYTNTYVHAHTKEGEKRFWENPIKDVFLDLALIVNDLSASLFPSILYLFIRDPLAYAFLILI